MCNPRYSKRFVFKDKVENLWVYKYGKGTGFQPQPVI